MGVEKEEEEEEVAIAMKCNVTFSIYSSLLVNMRRHRVHHHKRGRGILSTLKRAYHLGHKAYHIGKRVHHALTSGGRVGHRHRGRRTPLMRLV